MLPSASLLMQRSVKLLRQDFSSSRCYFEHCSFYFSCLLTVLMFFSYQLRRNDLLIVKVNFSS
jgi:hypothetical protein